MYKLLVFLFLSLATCQSAMAVPAKRVWRTVVQDDGSSLELMLVGDEHFHYFITRDSIPVVAEAENRYCYADVSETGLVSSGVLAHEPGMRDKAEQARMTTVSAVNKVGKARMEKLRAHRKTRRLERNNAASFTGSKKAIVILAEFSDKTFSDGAEEARAFYSDMTNLEGFSLYDAPGSVHDYFADMSRGMFDLTFDVYGPVTVSKSARYYGGNVYNDVYEGVKNAGEFITEAVNLADDAYDIDWTRYDWDGDGEVEQVFVLYAGYGRATNGPFGTIWPHEATLDDVANEGCGGSGKILKDGVYVNTYACGNELNGSIGTTKMGMGVFCHEFSHCMGLPDMYDVDYGGNYGMGDWDLLDQGSYNGPRGLGWCPAGWTSYERNYAGWLDYTELLPDTKVTGMKELTDNDAEAYVIYNDGNNNEYYLLENRKQVSWDAYVPEEGLLIIHVDYDPLLWENNVVNTTGTFYKEDGYTEDFTNDHPRMTPIHKKTLLNTYYDTYPIEYGVVLIDSLTDNSSPVASVYNLNTDGTKYMHKPIYDISKDGNGDISFSFMPSDRGNANGIVTIRDAIAAERPIDVYNLNGTQVTSTVDGTVGSLRKGVYIVRMTGGKTSKIVIK